MGFIYRKIAAPEVRFMYFMSKLCYYRSTMFMETYQPPVADIDRHTRASDARGMVWIVPADDDRFGWITEAENALTDGPEYAAPGSFRRELPDAETLGVIWMGFGVALTVVGRKARSCAITGYGMTLVGLGSLSYAAGVASDVARQMEAMQMPAQDTLLPDMATPTQTFFVNPVAFSPTPTLTPAPTETLIPTLTPTPTDTPTPTVSPTPAMFPVSLADALFYCHDEDNMLVLGRRFVMKQIGATHATAECLPLGFEPGGPVDVTVSVDKEGFDYSSYSFAGVYLPYTFNAGQQYLVTVEDCDDSCEIALRDAGDTVIDYVIHTTIGNPQNQFIISNTGYTEGCVTIKLTDTGGGSGVKVRVEPYTP